MLFRSRGRLCAATIGKVRVQMADGQKGVTSPAPPVSEADSWRVEEPVVKLKPNGTSTNSEQEAGWSGEIVEPVLETSGNIIWFRDRNLLCTSSRPTQPCCPNAFVGC